MAADALRKEIKAFDVPAPHRRSKTSKEYFRSFLDMIKDYQDSAPKDKKFSTNKIDNLYDDMILKFPDLKFISTLINLSKIEGRTYTAEEKIQQYTCAAELEISFAPQ